LPQYKTSKTDR